MGDRACRNLNFQTYGGGTAGASQTLTKSFSLNFMYFGCYRWLLPRSSTRLRHIFVIPESGPLLCGLDRQTGWLGLLGEGKGLPLHPESILTQQDISLTSPPSFPFPTSKIRPFECLQRSAYLSPGL